VIASTPLSKIDLANFPADARARGHVLCIGDHEIQPEFLPQPWHPLHHDVATGPTHDIADKKQF